MKQSNLTIYCGFLFSLTAASIDIMLPSFDKMALGLDTSIELVQLSVPMFLFPFAFMQLFYGPASDRFGRQPVLQFGLALYVIGSVIVFISPSITLVLVGRFIQGLGAASGQVLARAILRDRNSGAALAQAMGMAMAIFSVAPIFAPLIGYLIAAVFDWQGVFLFLTLMGICLWILTRFVYKETNESLNPSALKLGSIWAAIKTVLSNWQSRSFLLVAILIHSTIILFVTNVAPLLDNQFGIRDLSFALVFAATGMGIPIGQFFNHRAVPRFGIANSMRVASFVVILVMTSMVALDYFALLSPISFCILMFIYSTSFLVVLSNATSLVIEPHPKIAGLTSAFYGFCTLGASSISSAIFIPLIDGNIQKWALVMLGFAFSSFCLLLITLKKLSIR